MDDLRFLGKFCLLLVIVLAAAGVALAAGFWLGSVVVAAFGLAGTAWATDLPLLTGVAVMCVGNYLVLPSIVQRFHSWMFK